MRDGSRRERTAQAARVLISEAPRDFQVLLRHHSKDTITSPASSSLSSSLNSEPIKIDKPLLCAFGARVNAGGFA